MALQRRSTATTADGRVTARPAVPRIGNGSLADQTTQALMESVLEGRFPDGRLPPEPELASLLAVSRTTVRTALQRLETAGLLSRAPARGTVVRPQVGHGTLALQRMVGFHQLLEERGHKVRVDQSWELREPPDAATCEALDLPEATPVLRTRKQFFADGYPAIFIWDEIPLTTVSPSIVDALQRADPAAVSDSIFDFTKSWLGRQISYSLVEIHAAVAHRGELPELRLREGTPYVELSEVHYADDLKPVAYSRVHVDDRFLRFSIVRHL